MLNAHERHRLVSYAANELRGMRGLVTRLRVECDAKPDRRTAIRFAPESAIQHAISNTRLPANRIDHAGIMDQAQRIGGKSERAHEGRPGWRPQGVF